VAGAGTLGVGLALGDGVGSALAAIALLLPGLLVHDAWRMAFIAEGRPERAVLVDAVWLVLQLVGVGWLSWAGAESAAPYVLAWGLAAAVAAVVGCVRAATSPRPLSSRRWLRAHWGLTRFLLYEEGLLQGSYQGSLLVVGAVAGLAGAGALRGAQVVLGPVSLLAMSAAAFLVPELARRAHLLAAQRLRLAAAAGVALAVLGLCWGAVMLLLPEGAGLALFGESWTGIRAVLFPTVLGQVGNLLSVGASAGVLALGRSDTVFRIHALDAVLILALGMVGLWLGGAVGAACGFAAAYWIVMPLWFRAVWRHSPVRGGRAAAAG